MRKRGLVIMKRILIVICAICLLLTAAADQERFAPKVFMYHLVLEQPFSDYTSLFVRPSALDAQVALLTRQNYRFLFAEEYEKTSTPSVILTFDDGYVDNYTEMFPILQKYGAKATVFLISDQIDKPGYLSREQILEMSASGLVSFQSHTKTHRDLTKLSEADIRTEFRYSKYVIESITGKPVKAVSYPEGQYTDKLTKIARDYFTRAYSTLPRPTPRREELYAISRKSVVRECTLEQFWKMAK